jgi:hypothetical protein
VTHVIFLGEDVSSCKSGLPPYDPDALGGGSDIDWNYVSDPANTGVRVYAASPERIHYLPTRLTTAEAQKRRRRTRTGITTVVAARHVSATQPWP